MLQLLYYVNKTDNGGTRGVSIARRLNQQIGYIQAVLPLGHISNGLGDALRFFAIWFLPPMWTHCGSLGNALQFFAISSVLTVLTETWHTRSS